MQRGRFRLGFLHDFMSLNRSLGSREKTTPITVTPGGTILARASWGCFA